LPARARLRDPAAVFAALGDETRLRLVSRLSSGGPASISRLTDGSGVTRQAVTKHLRVLAGAGLVRARRRGRESLWRLQPERLDEAQRSLDLIARQWDHALSKLKAFVESPLPDGDAAPRTTQPRAGE
jgi:DNA-binding transcriptional ArsR family regulator